MSIAMLSALHQVTNLVESVRYDYDTGLYTAYFGYYNPNSVAVNIPLGDNNKFVSHSEYDYLLPTVFNPGRHVNTSVVTWPGDGALVWKLRTPGGTPAGYATATAAMSIPFHDDDEDGVINNDDEYPQDPDRAYIVYTPAENQWGTIAFEDLWPDKGDYDMNDMVLDYNFQVVLNASNQIKDINASFKLRAVGAARNNGFAIEFPFPQSNIGIFSGQVDGEEYDMTLSQAGSRAVLRIIQNTADLGIVTGNGIFWNTQMSEPKYPHKDISFIMTLSTPIALAALPYGAPFNPFILVNGEAGKEVHLPNMPPTANANPAYFGTGDDTTDLESERYYKTVNNLPWAIHIPISWTYPIERAFITHGYLAFKPWAESSGVSYPGWYNLSPADQVDLGYIYTK